MGRGCVAEQDKVVLHQRDPLKRYQKRVEQSLENNRQLAKKCLASGRKEYCICPSGDETVDVLKHGNEALKKMYAMVDINEVKSIMDETPEGIEKKQEIGSLFSEALSEQYENDVLIELDALVVKEEAEKLKLPEVPQTSCLCLQQMKR
uniref:Uncharacterized protein n=1 Tax=Glossina austeni TaxID=7395 RepID=A0A1A9V1D0_GLOAU